MNKKSVYRQIKITEVRHNVHNEPIEKQSTLPVPDFGLDDVSDKKTPAGGPKKKLDQPYTNKQIAEKMVERN